MIDDESRAGLLSLRVNKERLGPVIKKLLETFEMGYSETEVRAGAAIFIEQFWGDIAEWIEKNGAELPAPVWSNSDSGAVPDTNLAGLEPDNLLQVMQTDLDIFLGKKIEDMCKRYQIAVENEGTGQVINPDLDLDLVKLYKVWSPKTLRQSGNHWRADPVGYIRAGIHTANEVAVQILGVMPKVYEKQFNRKPSEGDLKEIFENAKTLISVLAAIDITAFVKLQNQLRGDMSKGDYLPDFFQIITQTDKDETVHQILKINPDIIAEVKRTTNMVGATNGCPAIAATGPSGESVIAEFLHWVQAVAEKYYFPKVAVQTKSVEEN